MEKRLNVSYSRPSYAAFYPKGQEGNARQIKIVSPPSQPIWYVSAEISMISVIILFDIFNFQNSNQFKMSQNSVFCLKQFLCLSLCLLQAVHYLHLSPHGQCEANDHHPGTYAAQGYWQGRQPKPTYHQQKQTPKGVYIRTNSGKIFAVRAKFPLSGSTTAVASSSSPVTSATNSSTSSG